MQKQWFVIHTLTGKEIKVRDALKRKASEPEIKDLIGEVIVPSETVSEVKKGKKITTTRMFYPGYVLAELTLYNDDKKINENTWIAVTAIPGVIGFLGGNKPSALPDTEVHSIIHQAETTKEQVKPKVAFEPGETIKINDGPFLNFNGVIEEVDPGRGKLKVSVTIFGRTAPVELEYWQVERV
jgi:transcriptional antiterminator NusG